MAFRYLDKDGALSFWTNIKNFILSKIPTKTSELTNDSGYITNTDTCLHKSGGETFTGYKKVENINSGLIFKSTNYQAEIRLSGNEPYDVSIVSHKLSNDTYSYHTLMDRYGNVFPGIYRPRASNLTVYVSNAVSNNDGDGLTANTAFSYSALRNFLGAIRMQSSSSLGGTYSLTVNLIPTGTSYGTCRFDSTKMPYVKNLVIQTSTGIEGTPENYTTNCPDLSQLYISGNMDVTIRNIKCGEIGVYQGAKVTLTNFNAVGQVRADNNGYVNVGGYLYVFYFPLSTAPRASLFDASLDGHIRIENTNTTINFSEQVYYTAGVMRAINHGYLYANISRWKLLGIKPCVIVGSSTTVLTTCSTPGNVSAKTVETGTTIGTSSVIGVTFSETNTANNPTLNVNGLGDWPIVADNNAVDIKHYLPFGVRIIFKRFGNTWKITNTKDVLQCIYSDCSMYVSGNLGTTYNNGEFNFGDYIVSQSTSSTNTGIYNATQYNINGTNIFDGIRTITQPWVYTATPSIKLTTTLGGTVYQDKGIKFTDTNGASIGYLYGCTFNNGNSGVGISASNVIDNTTVSKGIRVVLTNDGKSYLYPGNPDDTSLGSEYFTWKGVYANKYYLGSTEFGDIVTHNASEFLTSHQSLSNYVTLNGTQTISGAKTFSGLTKTAGKTEQSSPSDLNDAILNAETTYWGTGTTNKPASSYGTLLTFNREGNVHTSTSNGWLAQLGLGTDTRLYLRTKANTGGAWSAWKEFLTSHQSLSSCVKNNVTNNQTIKSTAITRGTAPSSAQTFGIAFSDNNNKYIGNIYGQYATDKSTYVGLYAYKGTTTSNSDNVSVRVGYDASGNVYTYAPTPATADNSTQIATTAFVKAQGYLTSHPSITLSTNTTSTASPTHGGTFTCIDSVTQDTNGHITKVNTKTVTLPSDNNTDTLMTQNVSTTNSTYPILLCPTANATSNQGAKTGIFAKSVKINPSTNVVSASGFSGPLTGNVTGNCSGSSGSCTGNAATATQFSANTTVALTGDATGTSAGSKKGWSVPVTLANSGVTAGTYGPSADVTGNNNATISVPEITVDAKGRVTSVTNRTYTSVNTDTNTDTKVTQTVTTGNSNYPVLLCATADATATGTTTSRFSAGLAVNARYSSISMTNKYDTANTKGVRDSTKGYLNGDIIFKCYDASEMGRIHCESSKNGYQQTYMQAKSYIKNGAISPEGTATTCYITVRVRDNGSKTIYTDGSWENSLTPYANNTHSLGTSSLQWKNAYAVNFYENGTALSSKYAINENFGKGTTTYLYINATDFPTGSGSSIQHLDVVDGTKLYVWYSVCNSSSILDIQPTANRVTTVTGQVWRYLGRTVHATGLGHQGASPTGILGLFRRES